jgi:hypothetical protein
LASIPLERDEGEYAYIAQRWLRGDVPYRDAFDQKPPGAFAVYAACFVLFGESIESIHWGVQLYTLLTLVGIGWIARRVGGPGAGWVAAVLAAFMTADASVLGNAANTETIMILPLTAGLAVCLAAIDVDSGVLGALSGVCGTLALLSKQVALPNVAWHGLLLLFCARSRWRLTLAYAAGGVFAAVPVVWYFASVGALSDFWDCVVGHNLTYARRVPLEWYPSMFFSTFQGVFRQWLPVFIFAGMGLRSLRAGQGACAGRWLLVGWLAVSFAGVCAGGYFRHHYFIQIVPALAVAAGVGVAADARRINPSRPGTAALVFTVAAVAWGIALDPGYYLRGSPNEKCRWIYGLNPFIEALPAKDYIARHSAPDETVFVFGSEPEILFYANRRSASRYIFAYPLMTPFPDTRDRQASVIRELTAAPPRFIVTISTKLTSSFLDDNNTPTLLFDELIKMLFRDYQLVGTIGLNETELRPFTGKLSQDMVLPKIVEGALAIWRRRD